MSIVVHSGGICMNALAIVKVNVQMLISYGKTLQRKWPNLNTLFKLKTLPHGSKCEEYEKLADV